MKHVINIKTAELSVTHNDNIINTGSVGSCVVIALYDQTAGVGGLAHAMLPAKEDAVIDDETAPAKYVDQAINNLIEGIKKIGGKQENLIAKIVGGASMFKKLTDNEHGIGYLNTSSAKNYLASLGIPLASEDTGGSSGKIVEFDLENGVLSVYTRL